MIIAVYEDTMGSAALCDENAQSAQLERLLEFYSPDEIPPEPSHQLRRIPYNVTTGSPYFECLCLDLVVSFLRWKLAQTSPHKLR